MQYIFLDMYNKSRLYMYILRLWNMQYYQSHFRLEFPLYAVLLVIDD